jgi:predicted PurR-regulated permease PerM
MRTLLMTVIGVAFAVAFDVVVTMLHQHGKSRAADGALLFIWIWLAITIVDFWVGVEEGHGVLLELGVHALIFVVPAAAAWYLSRRRRASAVKPD